MDHILPRGKSCKHAESCLKDNQLLTIYVSLIDKGDTQFFDIQLCDIHEIQDILTAVPVVSDTGDIGLQVYHTTLEVSLKPCIVTPC